MGCTEDRWKTHPRGTALASQSVSGACRSGNPAWIVGKGEDGPVWLSPFSPYALGAARPARRCAEAALRAIS